MTSLFLFAYRICWSFPVSESKADIVCVLGLPLRASVGFVFQPVPQNMYEEFVQVTLIFFLPIFRSMSKHVQRKDQYRMNELLTIDDYSMYIQYVYIIYIHICICMQREDFTSMIGDFEHEFSLQLSSIYIKGREIGTHMSQTQHLLVWSTKIGWNLNVFLWFKSPTNIPWQYIISARSCWFSTLSSWYPLNIQIAGESPLSLATSLFRLRNNK